jgi:hypothetical protein
MKSRERKTGNKNNQLAYQEHSCSATSETMGRREDGNYTPQKKNSIEDLVGNEKNSYPVPDPKKTMKNITKEPSDAHKKTLKEKILEQITEKLM